MTQELTDIQQDQVASIKWLKRHEFDLIIKIELLKSVKQARAEYKKGEVIHAKSLDELL